MSFKELTYDDLEVVNGGLNGEVCHDFGYVSFYFNVYIGTPAMMGGVLIHLLTK